MSYVDETSHNARRDSTSFDVLAQQPLIEHVQQLRPVLKLVGQGAIFYAIVGTCYLLLVRPVYALPFAIMNFACLLGVLRLSPRSSKGLPFGFLVCLQQLFFFTIPWIAENETIESYPSATFLPAAIAFGVFMLCLVFSCSLARDLTRARRKQVLLFPKGFSFRKRIGSLALVLLAISLAVQILFFTGLYWQWGGSIAVAFYSVVRTTIILSAICGTFLGATLLYATPRIRLLFAILWMSNIVFVVSGVLLSAALGLVLALWAGLTAGGRKIPWTTVIVSVLIFAFLNQGKFVMRERYWGQNSRSPPMITQLPGYYQEWAQASLEKLTGASNDRLADNLDDDGQSLLSRINSLQNLLYITDALNNQQMSTLDGAGYYLLPSVFVPRILWKDKPRTHEGMVKLNIHFGRQKNIAATEVTYVAWGLLPEAMGNLGMWIGPIALGMFLGGLSGWLERWTGVKTLGSIEGIMGCIIFLQILISFEMAMGVLVASIFQMMAIVIAGGLLIRSIAR